MARFIISLMFLFSSAFADEQLYSSMNHSNYEPSYISMFFGLIIVICLIYITGILYTRLTKIKLTDSSEDRYAIRVISTTSLGPNKNLYVVKYNTNVSLIASTKDDIVYLKDLGEDYQD